MKKLLAGLLTVLLVFSLTGCLDGGTTESDDSSDQPKITIPNFTGADMLAKEYEATYSDANIVVEDQKVELQTITEETSNLDIFKIDIIWPGKIADHVLNLNQYLDSEVTSQHFSEYIANNTANDKLVAIPRSIAVGFLYYRTDLLQEYNYSNPPETWAELENMAQTIQSGEQSEGKSNFHGYVWQGDNYEGLTCNALEWIYSYGGGKIINDNQEITINNQQAIDAVKMAADWPGTISPSAITNYTESDTHTTWKNGNAAFMRNWPYAYELSQQDDSAVKGKFAIAPLPAANSTGQHASTLGGQSLAVNDQTDHPELAAKVVKFMTSKTMQKQMCLEFGMTPTIKSLYEDQQLLDKYPYLQKTKTAFENAVARPSTVTGSQYSQVSDKFSSAVHAVLTGDKTADTALADLEAELQNLLGFKTSNPQ